MVAGSESRSACAVGRRTGSVWAVPASLALGTFFLPAALLDLGAEFCRGVKLAQVTGAFPVVTAVMLPLLLFVAFGQVGEVGCLRGVETRYPLLACLLLPAQEGIRRFLALAGVLGCLPGVEFCFDRVDEAVDAGPGPPGFAEIAFAGGLLQGVEVAELLAGFFFKDMGRLLVFGFLPEAQFAGLFRMAFAQRPLKGGGFLHGEGSVAAPAVVLTAGEPQGSPRGCLGRGCALLLKRLGLFDARDGFQVNVGHEGAQIGGLTPLSAAPGCRSGRRRPR